MARIMIGAGGTGGHVYPALAVAEVLATQDHTLTFIGTTGGMEQRMVDVSGIPFAAFHTVTAGPVVGVSPPRAINSLLKMLLGTVMALVYVVRHRPQAILFTGGWANVPVAIAAWLLRRPMLVYLPDIAPGRTVQVLARLAKQVAVTVDDSRQHFPEADIIVTGYPLRQAFRTGNRAAALARYQLKPDKKTLLVFGGSSGARSINIALAAILPDLLADGLQIIHISGTLDYERTQEEVAGITHPDYHLYAYLDDIGMAFAVADLVVCRSGASTLAELPFYGVPAILVPYPYAWDYQKINADYLAQHGAAVRLNDEHMTGCLLDVIREIMQDEKRRQTMQKCARALAQSDGAERLAHVLLTLAGEQAT